MPPLPGSRQFLLTVTGSALVQEVFIIPQRQRAADIEHHRQEDDLGAGLEVPERAVLGYETRLIASPARFKKVCADGGFSRQQVS